MVSEFDILTVAASIASLVSFSILLWGYFTYRKAERELRSRHIVSDRSKLDLSKQPVGIAIGIGKDLKASVRNFLDGEGLKGMTLLSIETEWLKPEDYKTAIIEINKLKKDVLKLGATEILLFYGGPVDLAHYVGAVFQNWGPVRVYARNDGTYRHTITLDKNLAGMRPMAEHLIEAARSV
jgi:hypothetical protein